MPCRRLQEVWLFVDFVVVLAPALAAVVLVLGLDLARVLALGHVVVAAAVVIAIAAAMVVLLAIVSWLIVIVVISV
jgi:hypothetical protein